MRKHVFLFLFMILLLSSCTKQTLHIVLNEEVIVEYGEELDDKKLYDVASSDKNIRIKEITNYDKGKVGTQTINIVFTNDSNKTKEVETVIIVKDSKAPEITLMHDVVEITAGDEYDAKSNITSVKDPIDGDLNYHTESVESNGYFIQLNDFDHQKVGTYEVNVKAIDQNGNQAEKKFSITVKETEVNPSPPSTTQSNNEQGSTNSSSNNATTSSPNNSASTPSNNNGSVPSTAPQQPATPEPEKPQTCTIHPNEYGNTGTHFATKEEAKTWAETQIDDSTSPYFDNGYVLMEMGDSCDKSVGWSISFY